MAKANEEKSGDTLAGLAADKTPRSAWRQKSCCPRSPWKNCATTQCRPLRNGRSHAHHPGRRQRKNLQRNQIKNSQRKLREWILDIRTTGADIRRVSRGLTSEMVAAVAKLMSNMDLVYGARKIRITAHCNTTIGEEGTLSARSAAQPPDGQPRRHHGVPAGGPDLRHRRRQYWA